MSLILSISLSFNSVALLFKSAGLACFSVSALSNISFSKAAGLLLTVCLCVSLSLSLSFSLSLSVSLSLCLSLSLLGQLPQLDPTDS